MEISTRRHLPHDGSLQGCGHRRAEYAFNAAARPVGMALQRTAGAAPQDAGAAEQNVEPAQGGRGDNRRRGRGAIRPASRPTGGAGACSGGGNGRAGGKARIRVKTARGRPACGARRRLHRPPGSIGNRIPSSPTRAHCPRLQGNDQQPAQCGSAPEGGTRQPGHAMGAHGAQGRRRP